MDQDNPQAARDKLDRAIFVAAFLWPFGVVALVLAESCVVRHMEDHLVFLFFAGAPIAIVGLLPARRAVRVSRGRRLQLAGFALSLNYVTATVGVLVLLFGLYSLL
jgi:hypothetical protein